MQKKCIDYKKPFSPSSSKKSFRIIMTLIVHFNFELYHTNKKIVFLNGHIDEMIYIMQSEEFVLRDPKNMVCKFKKIIYGLK